MSIDQRFIKALQVETMRKQDLHAEREPHVIFQTSTIDALLDGAYDGEVSFGELRQHGDYGLGTFVACDGEMIAVDGEFYRAAVDGSVASVPDAELTPFAVVTFFKAETRAAIAQPLDQNGLLALVDSRLGAGAACQALRVDGRFDYVQVRSVPRQRKPYPPLAEVANQHRVFMLEDIAGTCSIAAFRAARWKSTIPPSCTSSSRRASMLRRPPRARGSVSCWTRSRAGPRRATAGAHRGRRFAG